MFISLQKINFIIHYFLETLHSLVRQGCLAAPIRYDSTNFLNTLMFISTKVKFISYFILEILQRFRKIVILNIWARIAILTNLNSINLQKDQLICMQKMNFMPPVFLEILQNYCKERLFWVLWACVIMVIKNDGTCFKETKETNKQGNQ